MTFSRAHKIRLYPTGAQEVQLRKTAGTVRYAYNWAITRSRELYEEYKEGLREAPPSAFELDALWTQERPEWSHEVCRCSQSRAIQDFGKAMKAFFRHQNKYPKKHKKGRHRDSFYADNTHAQLRPDGRHIRLPKIGDVKLAEGIRYQGKIMGYTVSQDNGVWYVSIQMELQEDPRYGLPDGPRVGIDVGLATPAITSDGVRCELSSIQSQRVSQARRRMKNIQRAQARSRQVSDKQSKQKSKRYLKLQKKLQKYQKYINDVTKDVTHKFTTATTKNHGVVVVEDLNIQGMKASAKWRSLRRSLQGSMMGHILSQLEYKAKYLEKVPRYFASSKTCSQCGHKKDDLKLQERTYVCPYCGLTINRDLNAAINIRDYRPRSGG